MSQNLSFRVASLADAEAVVEITNEAFIADTFFKKPKYHQRFDLPTVIEMINGENRMFLLAESIPEAGGDKSIAGSLFLHWDVRQNGSLREVVGKFSAVSVPSRFSKQGIGKALVNEAESRIREIAKNLSRDHPDPEVMTNASLQMGVINQRQDLFPWYEKQGFQITGEIRGDPEVERIVLDDMKDDIYLVLMSKPIDLH